MARVCVVVWGRVVWCKGKWERDTKWGVVVKGVGNVNKFLSAGHFELCATVLGAAFGRGVIGDGYGVSKSFERKTS